MQQTLKSMVTRVKPTDYVQAKSFLKSLAYEARLAPQIEGVASTNVVSGR